MRPAHSSGPRPVPRSQRVEQGTERKEIPQVLVNQLDRARVSVYRSWANQGMSAGEFGDVERWPSG